MKPMVTCIVVAAGRSRRMGKQIDKITVPLAGHPLVVHSLAVLSSLTAVENIVVVTAERSLATLRALVDKYGLCKVRAIVAGGETRQQSVACGLAAIDWPADLVAVHDGARPCLSRREAEAVVADGMAYGAAILAIPVQDTIKVVETGVVQSTLQRSQLWAAQTPQVFRRSWLEEAHQRAAARRLAATDDAALVAELGYAVHVTPGSAANIKVTTPEDLLMAAAFLEEGGRLCL